MTALGASGECPTLVRTEHALVRTEHALVRTEHAHAKSEHRDHGTASANQTMEEENEMTFKHRAAGIVALLAGARLTAVITANDDISSG
jgi:hypothetical protein